MPHEVSNPHAFRLLSISAGTGRPVPDRRCSHRLSSTSVPGQQP